MLSASTFSLTKLPSSFWSLSKETFETIKINLRSASYGLSTPYKSSLTDKITVASSGCPICFFARASSSALVVSARTFKIAVHLSARGSSFQPGLASGKRARWTLARWSLCSGMCAQISSAVNGRSGAISLTSESNRSYMTVWALLRAWDLGGEVYSRSLRISR